MKETSTPVLLVQEAKPLPVAEPIEVNVPAQQIPAQKFVVKQQSVTVPEPIIVVEAAKPAPQTVTERTVYVEVPKESNKVAAMQQAHKELVKKYPNMRPAVEMLDSYAAQIEAGMSSQQSSAQQ